MQFDNRVHRTINGSTYHTAMVDHISAALAELTDPAKRARWDGQEDFQVWTRAGRHYQWDFYNICFKECEYGQEYPGEAGVA